MLRDLGQTFVGSHFIRIRQSGGAEVLVAGRD